MLRGEIVGSDKLPARLSAPEHLCLGLGAELLAAPPARDDSKRPESEGSRSRWSPTRSRFRLADRELCVADGNNPNPAPAKKTDEDGPVPPGRLD